MAKCPNCGYPRVKYNVSRRQYHKGHSHGNIEPRKDFNAYCPKCKKKWIDSNDPDIVLKHIIEKNDEILKGLA